MFLCQKTDTIDNWIKLSEYNAITKLNIHLSNLKQLIIGIYYAFSEERLDLTFASLMCMEEWGMGLPLPGAKRVLNWADVIVTCLHFPGKRDPPFIY